MEVRDGLVMVRWAFGMGAPLHRPEKSFTIGGRLSITLDVS